LTLTLQMFAKCVFVGWNKSTLLVVGRNNKRLHGKFSLIDLAGEFCRWFTSYCRRETLLDVSRAYEQAVLHVCIRHFLQTWYSKTSSKTVSLKPTTHAPESGTGNRRNKFDARFWSVCHTVGIKLLPAPISGVKQKLLYFCTGISVNCLLWFVDGFVYIQCFQRLGNFEFEDRLGT